MTILAWIVIGGIAGWLASILMRTDDSMGIPANIIVGILGALIGGWLMTLFGGPTFTGFNFSSLIVALLGSVVLLAIVRAFRRPVSRGL